MLVAACSDGGSESAPNTTAVTTTTLSTAPVPVADLHIASEFRVALVGGDGGVLLVDGSSGDGRSIAAWRIDRDDPTTALPVALPVGGRYGWVQADGLGDAFVVVAQRCPSDLWDDPAVRDLDAPESTMDPCGSTAHDVILVPSDGSEATLIAEGLEPEHDPEGSLIPLAATPTRAYLHWTDGTDGYVVTTDLELSPVVSLDPRASTYCSADDEIYAVARGAMGQPGAVPMPIGERISVWRLVGLRWKPVVVPPGPSTPYAGLRDCQDGRVAFNTDDDEVEGTPVLDLHGAAPTWSRSTSPIAPRPTREVEGGTLELVPHPSGEGVAVELVPGS